MAGATLLLFLGDRIYLTDGVGHGPQILDHPGVHDVDGVSATRPVVLPGALYDQHARGGVGTLHPGQRMLGDIVGHGTETVDVAVEHPVHGDEMRTRHDAVDVLEREVKGMQTLDDCASVLHREAGDAVARAALEVLPIFPCHI
ncbi:hypothetical protein [Streptomyces fagopyri]|uniref:hypothetical protein n=1 Tax=Streptomyces fagopyri TaxID=2662397 RepID=UPI003401903F